MARKADLRLTREGTVINTTSIKQESALIVALAATRRSLEEKYGVRLKHEREWKLASVVADLSAAFPDVEFHHHFRTSAMRPDGGILSAVDSEDTAHPILIVEVKNQGTNDLRATEGKAKQAKGNAIERLGKNVIGFRTAMLSENIMPFVCFGYGCDFKADSSILDRVTTIAMFGPLNRINVVNEGEGGRFNRGSFFFREAQWTEPEMSEIMYQVAERSLYYYFAKFGEAHFVSP